MEVVGMTAKAHDRIVVESQKVGQPPREGEILEIIEGTTQVHEEILGRGFVDAAPKTRP